MSERVCAPRSRAKVRAIAEANGWEITEDKDYTSGYGRPCAVMELEKVTDIGQVCWRVYWRNGRWHDATTRISRHGGMAYGFRSAEFLDCLTQRGGGWVNDGMNVS